MLEHLPERDRPALKNRLRKAWASDDHAFALNGLQALAGELDRSHRGAAASLREGLEETLSSPASGSMAASSAPCRAPTRSSR